MSMTFSITEGKRRLPALLRDIENHPEQRFLITIRNRVVAEIRAANPTGKPGEIGKNLIEAAAKLSKRFTGSHSVARNHDEYLYTRS